MAEKIEALTMPKWGIEMEEGKITEWIIDEGKSFKRGEVLLVIETDKISNEVEAEFDGLFRKKVVEADGTYPVGALLGVFAEESIADDEVEKFVNDFVPPETSFKPESASSSSQPEEKKYVTSKVDNVSKHGLSIMKQCISCTDAPNPAGVHPLLKTNTRDPSGFLTNRFHILRWK